MLLLQFLSSSRGCCAVHRSQLLLTLTDRLVPLCYSVQRRSPWILPTRFLTRYEDECFQTAILCVCTHRACLMDVWLHCDIVHILTTWILYYARLRNAFQQRCKLIRKTPTVERNVEWHSKWGGGLDSRHTNRMSHSAAGYVKCFIYINARRCRKPGTALFKILIQTF